MTRIILADCGQHEIAVPTPTMPEDYACPHCKVKALQARLDAVKPYLEHKVVCVSWRGRDCNCGLAAALKQEPSDVS